MKAEISLSAGKALEIFRVLCETGQPSSIAAISKATGYPRTVAVRMIATLEYYGFLERDAETGQFSVSPLVLHQVQKGLLNSPIFTRVDMIMQEVVKCTGASVIYVIPSGNRALVMNRVEGSSTMKILTSQVGMELPLHCGGAPLAILAHSDEAFIESYLAGPLESRTKASMTDPAKIRQMLADIRARGYAVGQEDLFDYLVAVGVPIFGPRGELTGAISTGDISQKCPPERVAQLGRILVEISRSF
ncbi:MAG: hypothetical protein CL812_09065 [Confluentimicrobium sp.]|nr:hypothetical protein [Actibacterium sp.]|tara:strand:- start:14432 stop:15172 length:741 start_codon:yes stop_codon:yes gene_type:complete